MYSNEHSIFLNKEKKEKRIILFWRITIILLFLIIWELLGKLLIINTFLYSCPSMIVDTVIDLLISGELIKHISITLYEVILSFILATMIGIFFASILWTNKTISKILDPYITVINSLPKVALGPLIIIWVGASINSIICMALMISVFITIIGIYNSFVSVDNNYIVMLRSFGATKFQIYKKIVFPSSIDSIIAALKINISMSLIGVTMGELLVSKNGIGYLIMYGSQVFNINLVITSVIILGIISYIMYFIVDILEKTVKRKRYYFPNNY